MSGRKPGPTCASQLGKQWVDSGTLCRTRSGSPGPLGVLLSLAMGASPDGGADAAAAERKRNHQLFFEHDIAVIAGTAFGKSARGKEIVALLRELLRKSNIVYGETMEDSRGDWDGSTIRVNAEYDGKMYPTIFELVHEASHALWRKKNPQKQGQGSSKDEIINEEMLAQENQLAIYKELRKTVNCPEDLLMEKRLQNQANGKLRQAIADHFAETQ